MKRKLRIAGECSLFLAFLLWWMWPREWLTDELLAQIKPGIKLQEVRQLLGEPENLSFYDTKCDCIQKEKSYSLGLVYEPCDPWLPTIRGPLLHVDNLSTSKDLGPTTKEIWFGHRQAIVVIGDCEGNVTRFKVSPIEKTGGGPWGWLKRKYEDWRGQ